MKEKIFEKLEMWLPAIVYILMMHFALFGLSLPHIPELWIKAIVNLF